MTPKQALDLIAWNVVEYKKKDIKPAFIIIHPHLQRDLFHYFYYTGGMVSLDRMRGPDQMRFMDVPIISSYDFNEDQIEVVANLFK